MKCVSKKYDDFEKTIISLHSSIHVFVHKAYIFFSLILKPVSDWAKTKNACKKISIRNRGRVRKNWTKWKYYFFHNLKKVQVRRTSSVCPTFWHILRNKIDKNKLLYLMGTWRKICANLRWPKWNHMICHSVDKAIHLLFLCLRRWLFLCLFIRNATRSRDHTIIIAWYISYQIPHWMTKNIWIACLAKRKGKKRFEFVTKFSLYRHQNGHIQYTTKKST